MFSVIIPLYNKEKYIRRAIESVLNQTEQNFEIIVVNDGSIDNGVEVVRQIQSSKIVIFEQKNEGVSAARNKGASIAKNPYLAFLDADDIWDTNFLASVRQMIEVYPNAGIYGTNNLFVYPDGTMIKNEVCNLFKGKEFGILEDYFKIFSDLQRSPFSNSNFCIPKKIYDKVGGYKVGVKLTEDSDLWCRIAFVYSVIYFVKPLATYFLAQEGSTHTVFENKCFEVENTLRDALKNGVVKDIHTSSVKRLIALQQLGLIKRALLTNNKMEIISKLFCFSLFKYYPKEFLKCIFAFCLPYNLFIKIKK